MVGAELLGVGVELLGAVLEVLVLELVVVEDHRWELLLWLDPVK